MRVVEEVVFEEQVTVFNHQDGPHYRDLYPEPPPQFMAWQTSVRLVLWR